MIRVSGAINRSFRFPSRPADALDFFADARRTAGNLPHISLAESHGANRFRLLYHTVELGLYRVEIFCDVEFVVDQQRGLLAIRPFHGLPPVKQEFSLYAIKSQGEYASESFFKADGGATKVDYRLKIEANLPKPIALKVMPDSWVDGVASAVTNSRIDEIVSIFIERSVKTYQKPNPA